MSKFNTLKNSTVATTAGVLLWLALSPRIATRVYEANLMPRVRPERIGKVHSAQVSRVKFQSRGVDLEAMYYKHPSAEKVVLYCGGRRTNFAKLCIPAREFVELGLSVFTMEPEGHGDAVGRASLRSLVEGWLCAYDLLISMGYDPQNIVIYGESLGTAAAAYVSERRESAGLILQSGFSSLKSQIKEMIPLLAVYPSAMFPQPRLETAASLRRGHPPLLILHGDEDDVVKVKHAHQLAAAAGDNTTLAILQGAGHYFVYRRMDWQKAVSAFLDSLH